MPGDSPVKYPVNAPVPDPFDVEPYGSASVGFCVVFQTNPLAVTDAPPADVTLPPPVDVFCKIDDIEFVVTVGTDAVEQTDDEKAGTVSERLASCLVAQ